MGMFADSKSIGMSEEHPNEMVPPEKALLPNAVHELLSKKRGVYEAISARVGFTIEFGDRTCFKHQSKSIVVGVGHLEELGITDPSQIDFIILHELGHFQELAMDPDGYRRIMDEGKRDDGNGRIYFDFYNCLMDIYVNRNTLNKADEYGDKENASQFSGSIKSLYANKLFRERDLTDLPLAQQFSVYLLNQGMQVEGDLIISQAVREEISKGVTFLGSHFSYQQLIDTFLVPSMGLRASEGWQATAGERKGVIDLTLRPVFEKLLAIDKKEGSLNKFKKFTADHFEPSSEDLEKALDRIVEKVADEKKSIHDKTKEMRGQQAANIAQEAGLIPDQAEQFANILESVQPTVRDLVSLFRSLVDESTGIERTKEGYFKTGSYLNIGEAIRNFSDIQNNPEIVQVMERDFYNEKISAEPKKIRLWLVPDLSGSMSPQLPLLKKMTVAFSAALTTLNVGRDLGQHDIEGVLSVIGFNNSAVEIIPFTPNTSLDQVAQGYTKLHADGGTEDYHALERVIGNIRELPAEDRGINLVIELTDGESGTFEKTKQAINQLRGLPVTALAFRLGLPRQTSSQIDNGFRQDVFSSLWNDGQDRVGYYVPDLDSVIPVLCQVLRNHLNDSWNGKGRS